MSTTAEAAIILIDNSSTSINGDFYPNRLDAQKTAVDRLIQYMLRQSDKTQVGVGAIGSTEFGISGSLTNKFEKASRTITNIKRGGIAQLVQGIRCAFLALRRRDPQVSKHRVIAFIGSEHDLTEKASEELSSIAIKEGSSVDIVAFGCDCKNCDILEDFVKKVGNSSHFLRVEAGTGILSDAVLSSPIGPGAAARTPIDANIEDDPDLALAIRQSLEPQENDPEISEAIKASMETGGAENDPELDAAIKASLAEVNDETKSEEQKPSESKAETKAPVSNSEGCDLNDPEIQEAIRASMESGSQTSNSQNVVQNPDEFASLLMQLPDVDPNDPRLRKSNEKGDGNEEPKKGNEKDAKKVASPQPPSQNGK